ncbi:Uncharacterised protein [Citrobacter youngae]|uniref:Phage tail protein n=1 Tax=Citrobacter youngae TaxID=133448 RepID=A0A9Q8EAH8_9ENTR|nr:Uncharacterised protein [Citrobacter youngae]
MSAGTLTLTNNSALVSGAGTSFTTELAAGDFVVATVGGIPYTLPVKTIESNTGLTLVSNFTGPTQSGAAWSAVPRVALNMVTAALVTQSVEALRGLNYDKQNWQQFFTADGDVTITLPDTSQTTGPSAKKLISSVSLKADKSALNDYAKKGVNSDISSLEGLTTPLSITQGGTGSKNDSDARRALKVAWVHEVARPGGGIFRILNYNDSGLMIIVRRFSVIVPPNSAGGWNYSWKSDVGEAFKEYPGLSVHGMAGNSNTWSIGTESVSLDGAAGFVFNNSSSTVEVWMTITAVGTRT